MFTGVNWGVSVAEVLSGALEFILLFKEFLILGVVLILSPMLISFFKFVIDEKRWYRSQGVDSPHSGFGWVRWYRERRNEF